MARYYKNPKMRLLGLKILFLVSLSIHNHEYITVLPWHFQVHLLVWNPCSGTKMEEEYFIEEIHLSKEEITKYINDFSSKIQDMIDAVTNPDSYDAAGMDVVCFAFIHPIFYNYFHTKGY